MLFALWLSVVAAAVAPAPVASDLTLTIDECVAVDQSLVRAIMGLELGDGQAGQAVRPESIGVRCLDDLQEVRVEPWASKTAEGSRIIQLMPVRDAGNPAERQARSRELALAIAEFVRRLENTPLPEPPPPATPTPPPSVVVEVAPPAPPVSDRWTLGALSTFDHFQGGQNLVGGEVFLAAHWGRWVVMDLGLGGRWANEQTLSAPAGRLSKRALTASAGVGVDFIPPGHRVGARLMLRACEYLVQYRAESTVGEGAERALLGATILAAEPHLSLALTRRLSLEASAAIGTAMRGISVRSQGIATQSPSGLVLSGSLGAGVRF